MKNRSGMFHRSVMSMMAAQELSNSVFTSKRHKNYFSRYELNLTKSMDVKNPSKIQPQDYFVYYKNTVMKLNISGDGKLTWTKFEMGNEVLPDTADGHQNIMIGSKFYIIGGHHCSIIKAVNTFTGEVEDLAKMKYGNRA